MMHRATICCVLLGSFAFLAPVAQLVAQDPAATDDPFGTEAKVAPAPTAAPATKATAEPVETDPHVLAIRSTNPQTPLDLLIAIENLMNLGRPDEAKRYLKVLTDAKPDEATLWFLQRKRGSAIFFRLSTEEGMQPEGRVFADAALNAAHKMVRDPGRLDGLIRQLSSPEPAVRATAISELRSAGEDAAVAMVLVLADESRGNEHGAIRSALVQLGTAAEGPCLAALDSNSEALRGQALAVLSGLGSRDVIPFLLRPAIRGPINSAVRRVAERGLIKLIGAVPQLTAAERYLHREAVAYFDGKLPGKPDHEDLIATWRWDEAQQRPIMERVPRPTASLLVARRLATELHRLTPDNREYRKLYVAAILEFAKIASGWEVPLRPGESAAARTAAQVGAGELEEVLQFSLSSNHMAAAVGVIEVLGQTANSDVLRIADGRPRPLAQALRHPDRRVRFAALQAIRQIDPREEYAGASFVPEAIGSFIRTSGDRRILIAHPRLEQSQLLVGMLLEVGIEADQAPTGAQALQLASQGHDYEFLLLSDAIDQPNVRELLQQLRREPRTANLPVAILAREENMQRLSQLTQADALSITVVSPVDVPSLASMIGRLAERAGPTLVAPEERLRQASAALEFLAALAAKPEVYGFYDLLSQERSVEHALNTPQLTLAATRVLGWFATPTAQQSLVTLASQNERPLAVRQAAAAAFDQAGKLRGLLLTSEHILEQYDRYNLSATLDQDTQRVLGALLDIIERPSQTGG